LLSRFELEVYGRSEIRGSKRISNPGCYATSTQMLLAPLVDHLKPGVVPTVFGLSGYSGAGTVATTDPDGRPTSAPKVTPESLKRSVRSYALTDHIHEREAGFHLSRLLSPDANGIKVAFVPAVTPWFSGILSTASVPLAGRMSAREVARLFEERYGGERLVRILKGVPVLGDVEGRHGWVVGGFQVHSEGDRVVVVVRRSFFFLLFWVIDTSAGWPGQPTKRCGDTVHPSQCFFPGVFMF